MMLWLVFTSMIAVAAVLVSTPFIRRMERMRLHSAGNLAVYRDQLQEIETEVAQGAIDGTQAEGAILEIKRKVLASGRTDEPARPSLSQAERKFALTVVTAIVVFGSILLYALVGTPGLPSATPPQAIFEPPPASRLPAAGTQPRAAAATDAPASRGAGQPQTGLPSVDEMIQRVQAKLQRNPGDTEGWRMLGWAYFSVERFSDAANAYSKAIELRPGFAEYHSARGEALVRQADGTVTADARKDFNEAARIDPKDSRARFFTGLAKEQDGDKAAALADWKKLLAEADPSEPWLADLRDRVADLQRESLGDTDTLSPSSKPGISADAMRDFLQAEKSRQQAAEAPRRGPSAEDVRNAESMPPQDRTAMIRGMVDGLANRLEQQPRDSEGWIKLIRSRVVLGDAELANKSLKRALSVFSEDGPERTQIVGAARQLGLDP